MAMKMYIITDNKGIIREISSLGFAYFNLINDNLASAERYIDEFGVNFSGDVYDSQGNYMNLFKRPLHKSHVLKQNE